ncbi:MAG: hypothetical protein R3337_00310 [Gammaproteobacteria bacterium]|nr:hypothetical protein [Gammaproteobacteria bacterium]
MSWVYMKLWLAFAFAHITPSWYPPGENPETDEQREQRFELAGGAAASAGLSGEHGFKPWQAALMVGAVWIDETSLDYNVHAGKPTHIGHQDHGRARCLGQIQTWPGNTLLTRKEWESLAGTDYASTQLCANATVSYLWYHAQRCLRRKVAKAKRWDEPLTWPEVARLFAAYGEGHCAPVGKSAKGIAVIYQRIVRLRPRWSKRDNGELSR